MSLQRASQPIVVSFNFFHCLAQCCAMMHDCGNIPNLNDFSCFTFLCHFWSMYFLSLPFSQKKTFKMVFASKMTLIKIRYFNSNFFSLLSLIEAGKNCFGQERYPIGFPESTEAGKEIFFCECLSKEKNMGWTNPPIWNDILSEGTCIFNIHFSFILQECKSLIYSP